MSFSARGPNDAGESGLMTALREVTRSSGPFPISESSFYRIMSEFARLDPAFGQDELRRCNLALTNPALWQAMVDRQTWREYCEAHEEMHRA